jgi:hypothetical protein
MELDVWCHEKVGMLSIDADFFTLEEERSLAVYLEQWIAQKVGSAVPIVFHDEHVELIKHVRRRVDFIVNFDFHMDCRIEFLRGEDTKVPPCSASVFETLISQRMVDRYVWAVPRNRMAQAALVYSSALVLNAQPSLTRIHCVSGGYACEKILDHARIDSVFVCRSPDYATHETDAVFLRMKSAAAALHEECRRR